MLDFVYWSKAYQLFLCLVARLSGFLATAPFFASRNIQPSVRGFLSILLALLFLPLFSTGDLLLADTGWSLVLMLLKEVVLGLILGYASSIVFAAFQVAGQIIDMQMGFGMINVLIPVRKPGSNPASFTKMDCNQHNFHFMGPPTANLQ